MDWPTNQSLYCNPIMSFLYVPVCSFVYTLDVPKLFNILGNLATDTGELIFTALRGQRTRIGPAQPAFLGRLQHSLP
jgi:hypothetical protein